MMKFSSEASVDASCNHRAAVNKFFIMTSFLPSLNLKGKIKQTEPV